MTSVEKKKHNNKRHLVSSVIIPRKPELQQKLQHFSKSNIHIIADFDQTLTQYLDKDGGRNSSVYGQIRKHDYLGPGYSKKAYKLFDHYSPIEDSPLYSLEEKSKAMLEWWNKHMQLTRDHGLTKEMLYHIAERRDIRLWERALAFFRILAEQDIPLLIFSAGLGDVIEHYVKKRVKMTKNVHVISNFFRFDSQGVVAGFQKQIIHPFNKNEVAVREHPYYQEIKERKNAILLGDKVEDLHMSAGLGHEQIIAIGFLNEQDKASLEKFKASFDMVITGDGPLDAVTSLVEEIVGKKKG